VIEISAAVVDIDADNGKTLGVEFLSFGDGKNETIVRGGFEADRSFNEGNGSSGNGQPLFGDGTDLVRGSGALTSALIPVSGGKLLARIRALEEKGEAQLVTSPSVITLENVEASLRQDQTVFVRVAGREATDLFDVRTGVQLRVTPTVIREGDQLSFRLLVDVVDGSFSDLRVDDVPSTRESSINTQAVVPANRTLLIGGYFVDRQSKNSRQVPVLGDIPLVGRMFKRTEDNRSRAQRYFFITPRLVDIQKEARLNPVVAQTEKSPLPPTSTDPAKATDRAHALAAGARPDPRPPVKK
jgi:type III secretion protein C